MLWPQEGTRAPLQLLSENLCSVYHYCQKKKTTNSKPGCLNNGGKLEESQCNRIIKINAVTLPEKNPKQTIKTHMSYRSLFIQKDTKDPEKVEMWAMINI